MEHLNIMLVSMHSFLKLCFRKSYPEQLICRIIQCVGRIGRNCSILYNNENYKAITVSVLQLITFKSLNIQCTIISTLTTIWDTHFINKERDCENCTFQEYHTFCQSIYKTFDWKKFQDLKVVYEADQIDLFRNIMAINIQLLLAIITFDDFHRIAAFSELCYICSNYQLTKGNQ